MSRVEAAWVNQKQESKVRATDLSMASRLGNLQVVACWEP
jgi:hypothetical protein